MNLNQLKAKLERRYRLHFRYVRVAIEGCGKIRIFAHLFAVLEHLCDHVLTSPETKYWSLVMPGLRRDVNAKKEPELKALAEAMWSGKLASEKVDALYASYARIIEDGIRAADSQRWYWRERRRGPNGTLQRPVWKGLGGLGTFFVWGKGLLLTAMFRPLAAGKVAVDPLGRTVNPLPRVGRGIGIGHMVLAAKFADASELSMEEWYDIFVDCAENVKREFEHALVRKDVVVEPTEEWERLLSFDGDWFVFEEWKQVGEAAASELIPVA